MLLPPLLPPLRLRRLPGPAAAAAAASQAWSFLDLGPHLREAVTKAFASSDAPDALLAAGARRCLLITPLLLVGA